MTPLARCTLAALACAASVRADCNPGYPCYSAASVVNSASYASGWLAATTFASVFGSLLADQTLTGSPGSQDGSGALGGTRVLVNGLPAFISYVSPGQVNFVVPSNWSNAATVTVQLERGNQAGPAVTLALHDSAPALFQLDAVTAVAAHANWTLVTAQSPAHAGEVVTLYATGLGAYLNPVLDLSVPPSEDPIARLADFQLFLGGQPVDSGLISYVGAEPVAVGVYQIDLKLPANVGTNPEVRIALGTRLSPPGVVLPVE